MCAGYLRSFCSWSPAVLQTVICGLKSPLCFWGPSHGSCFPLFSVCFFVALLLNILCGSKLPDLLDAEHTTMWQHVTTTNTLVTRPLQCEAKFSSSCIGPACWLSVSWRADAEQISVNEISRKQQKWNHEISFWETAPWITWSISTSTWSGQGKSIWYMGMSMGS